MNRRIVCVLTAVAALAVIVVASTSSASAETVCNQYLQGLGPLDASRFAPPPVWGGCYPSEREAAAAARSAGRSVLAQKLIGGSGPASSPVKIGLDCDAGLSEVCAFSDHLWTYGANGPCDADTRYARRWVGDKWNDRFSGAQGFHHCNRYVHFADVGFKGDWLSCGPIDSYDPAVPPPQMACHTLGLLSDKTSSVEFHYCADKQRLCFRGR